MELKEKQKKKMKKIIHCPVPDCLYFYGSKRHFTMKKFLDQHIAKVHAEKKYSCGKCHRSFGQDWWRKHHEQTCGMEWKCDCGVKYTSRESLLTHARRFQHKLPDSILNTDKKKQKRITKESNKPPVILLLQPIVQHVTYIQPVLNAAPTTPTTWPKPIKPRLLPLPVSPAFTANVISACNPAYTSPGISPSPSKDNFVFNLQSNSPSDVASIQMLSPPKPPINVAASKNQKSASTQTSNELKCTLRESRASQCTRKNSKNSLVDIESTHTQTAESAVVKLKKRRPKRKSVAITAESNMLTSKNSCVGQSLWPDFKDLIFQNVTLPRNCSAKNTTSTQTSSSKVLCDSQTITEDEFFSFVLDDALKEKDTALFEMLPDIPDDPMMASLPGDLGHNNLPILEMYPSDNPGVTYNNCTASSRTLPSDLDSLTCKTLAEEPCPMFRVFEACSKVASNKTTPAVSDTHTQTLASTIMQYNLLANMETQTTDDFSMYDMEFLDTETQTPWEDFPNIDDSPLPVDQLSIEIQTDFSSLNLDQDPYGFIGYGLNVPNIMNECSNKETLGVNTETQTQDNFIFPEFTNSESQTLDLSNFMFPSLNT